MSVSKTNEENLFERAVEVVYCHVWKHSVTPHSTVNLVSNVVLPLRAVNKRLWNIFSSNEVWKPLFENRYKGTAAALIMNQVESTYKKRLRANPDVVSLCWRQFYAVVSEWLYLKRDRFRNHDWEDKSLPNVRRLTKGPLDPRYKPENYNLGYVSSCAVLEGESGVTYLLTTDENSLSYRKVFRESVSSPIIGPPHTVNLTSAFEIVKTFENLVLLCAGEQNLLEIWSMTGTEFVKLKQLKVPQGLQLHFKTTGYCTGFAMNQIFVMAMSKTVVPTAKGKYPDYHILIWSIATGLVVNSLALPELHGGVLERRGFSYSLALLHRKPTFLLDLPAMVSRGFQAGGRFILQLDHGWTRVRELQLRELERPIPTSCEVCTFFLTNAGLLVESDHQDLRVGAWDESTKDFCTEFASSRYDYTATTGSLAICSRVTLLGVQQADETAYEGVRCIPLNKSAPNSFPQKSKANLSYIDSERFFDGMSSDQFREKLISIFLTDSFAFCVYTNKDQYFGYETEPHPDQRRWVRVWDLTLLSLPFLDPNRIQPSN